MKASRLLFRSVAHYWRTHLGVMGGVAVGATVLVGALCVGDSVRATLRNFAQLRVGSIQALAFSEDRFFREVLAEDLRKEIEGTVAGGLVLQGSASKRRGEARANLVQISGVKPEFWSLAPDVMDGGSLREGEVWINERLAKQLNLSVGKTVEVQVEKPGALSRDAPLSGNRSNTIRVARKVGKVLGDGEFGRFALRGGHVAPYSVFFGLDDLQAALGMGDVANLMVSSEGVDDMGEVLDAGVKLEDFGLEIRRVEKGGVGGSWEVRSKRVFFDDELAAVVMNSPFSSVGVMSYFINGIRRVGEGSSGEETREVTPFSVVSGVPVEKVGIFERKLEAGEALIHSWLAKDLGVKAGDYIDLEYYVVGRQRELEEKNRRFQVVKILEDGGVGDDSRWMPDFPGLAGTESCGDWDTGMPLDREAMSEKDQDYWDEYKGTPKVFIGLDEAQEMWGNRFGAFTGMRFMDGGVSEEMIRTYFRNAFPAEKGGLFFLSMENVKEAATSSPVDFGELFIGFSFFLMVASVVLSGMMFVFVISQRESELGVLKASGWSAVSVRRLFLMEGALLALPGVVVGCLAGVGYTKVLLFGLEHFWRDAVGGIQFEFEVGVLSVLGGGLVQWVLAVGAVFLGLKNFEKARVASLVYGRTQIEGVGAGGKGGGQRALWVGGVLVLLGVLGSVVLFFSEGMADMVLKGGFLGMGFAVFGGGICLCRWWLGQVRFRESGRNLSGLSRKNVGRRAWRSLIVVGVLGFGVFMVMGVGGFWNGKVEDPYDRQSGTGGFVLGGMGTLPLYENLNTTEGRKALGLYGEVWSKLKVVPFRVKEGDEASCLNLNGVIQPRVIGVDPEEFVKRGAFPMKGEWKLLQQEFEDGAVPAIADENTLMWSLGLGVGDDFLYQDEQGEEVKLRIVGMVRRSILQGNVIIAENRYSELFPSSPGYRFFLMELEAGEDVVMAREKISKDLSSYGLEVWESAGRLSEFQSVENTYLSIFQVLGGLGVLLGSAGMAVVVVRNVMERRGEFGLLEAVGFSRRRVQKLVFLENRWLMVWALGVGGGAGLLATGPMLFERGFVVVGSYLIFLIPLVIFCVFWGWFAGRWALSQIGVKDLRSEQGLRL